MPKHFVKRRSSYGRPKLSATATLRRRKSSPVVLQSHCGRHPETENYALELKRGSMNVSAGGNFYERARSRHERQRLALKNAMALGEVDETNHFVALGRGGARGPNRSSLTKEVQEGVDPGLEAIERSRRTYRRKQTAVLPTKQGRVFASVSRVKSTAKSTLGAGSSERKTTLFADKMNTTRKRSNPTSIRERVRR